MILLLLLLFNSHAHGVEPGQILASKPFVHKGFNQKLVTFTENCNIQEGFTDPEGVLGSELPEGFIPTIGNIGRTWLVGVSPRAREIPSSSLRHSAVSLSNWPV